MAKQYEWRFVVTGRGQFPLDMLRYDLAYPRFEKDSSLIEQTFRPREPQAGRHIDLVSRRHAPTEDRWKSFGWHVEKVEKVQG